MSRLRVAKLGPIIGHVTHETATCRGQPHTDAFQQARLELVKLLSFGHLKAAASASTVVTNLRPLFAAT